MGDMLSSATSGLLAFQRALDTTSHNISNVNTVGYSRQSVTIGTRLPEAYPNGFVGSGADAVRKR
jgi:flagellar hook-associated protein 1 FlgK